MSETNRFGTTDVLAAVRYDVEVSPLGVRASETLVLAFAAIPSYRSARAPSEPVFEIEVPSRVCASCPE